MTDLTATLPTPRTPAEYRAALEQLNNEMLRAFERMEQNQTEKEQLRAKSDAITKHTDSVLEQLSHQIAALTKRA